MSRWCLGLFASAVSTYGVCIGWACSLWRQSLCSVAVLDCFNYYVASKGDVKAFFGLRFGRFSARVQMVFASFLHLQCSDDVCIGWACALWLQRLFYVDSKGDVKAFFGLRFGRFSARVQMVFRSFCICSVQMVFA